MIRKYYTYAICKLALKLYATVNCAEILQNDVAFRKGFRNGPKEAPCYGSICDPTDKVRPVKALQP
jgi:hypothetical protein